MNLNVINCFKENNPVINQKLKEVSVEDGLQIATQLFEVLNKRETIRRTRKKG